MDHVGWLWCFTGYHFSDWGAYFSEKGVRPKNRPCSRASLAGKSENKASCKIHFVRLLSVSGGSTKNDKTFGWNLERSFSRCVRGFTSFFAIRVLRLLSVSGGFHFGRPECLNVLFFQFPKFWFSYGDSHHFCIQGLKLWFSSKDSQQKCHPANLLQNCGSRTRILITAVQNIMYFDGFYKTCDYLLRILTHLTRQVIFASSWPSSWPQEFWFS